MDGGNAKTLESYEDLVFSPLALPSPPKADTKRLVAWMTWAREEGFKRGLNLPEQGFEARKGRPYPWLMACVYYMNRHLTPPSRSRKVIEAMPSISQGVSSRQSA